MSNRGDDDGSADFAAALQRALAHETPPPAASPAPPASLALSFIGGPSTRRIFPLTATDTLTVGRGSTCNLVIADDPGISGSHFTLTPTSAGWLIEVAQSSSGAFVNGQRVMRAILNIDDKIQLGTRTILALRRHEDPAVRVSEERDQLTGVCNRMAFVARLKVAFPSAIAANEPLTVALANLVKAASVARAAHRRARARRCARCRRVCRRETARAPAARAAP